MKISVCITVKNEEKTVGDLLTSLLGQSLKPDEIVVVDGCSSDKTFAILRHLAKKDKRIKIVREPGSIAHGRNTGIEVANNDIVVTTDAGCIPHPDWLEKITEPFLIHLGGDPAAAGPPSEEYTEVSIVSHSRGGIGVVAGFYEMPAKNSFQKAAGVYLGVPPERFDPQKFLPSTRSVAFRKSVWEDLGGFNEKLQKGAEDSDFFYRCVKKSVKIVRVGEARVDWKEIENISFKEAMRKFFNYAKGDVQSKIWRHPFKTITSHNIKVILIFIRYFVGLILLVFSVFNPASLVLLVILAILYLLWPIYKWRDVIFDWKARLWLPVIQISSDFAVMSGFIRGIFSRK